MPTNPLNRVIQHVLADLVPDGGGMTDGGLLARFLSSRDDDALAALVRRHAPMVWGVCCRLLHSHHDAEDAFQATFLVLVRKAADVPRQAVANWLYGVARQTAVRLRATAAKRGRRETQVVTMPEPTVKEVWDADLRDVLDEELSRLPDHYRGVIVLCNLEGMTRKEAARQLGIPEGSVASRLARARAMLAKRLSRRGIVFSGGAVAAALAAESGSASPPPALVASTIKAASLLAASGTGGVVSAKVAALTEGVMKVMFLTKLKSVMTVVLAGVVAVGIGAGLLGYGAAAGRQGESRQADAVAPQKQAAEPQKVRAEAEKPGTKTAIEESARKIQELQKERIATLKDMADALTRLFQSGRGAFEPVLEARLLVLQAELDAAEKESERITLYKNFVDLLKQHEKWADQNVKLARGTMASVLKVRAMRLEAEIHLEQAKIKEAKERNCTFRH
jgi:RNA polymerase sigma factor (sigma-70 family)